MPASQDFIVSASRCLAQVAKVFFFSSGHSVSLVYGLHVTSVSVLFLLFYEYNFLKGYLHPSYADTRSFSRFLITLI